MTSPTLFDQGLQPERTALAWRRSTLSVAAGALIALRLLPTVLGLVGIITALGGLVMAALLWLVARRRANTIQRALRNPVPALPGGGLMVTLATLTAGGAIVGLVYLTVHETR